MKRYKKLGILLGVLVVICVAAFAVSRHEEKKEKIKNSDETILSIDKDDVTALSWEYEDHSYAFHKDDEWVYDSDSDFPVSQDEMDTLLDVFSSFDVAFTIDDVEDYSQYGLDDPTCTIKFTAGDKDYEVKLGDYSKMDEQRYVSIGDGKVYLAANDPFDTYEVEMTDLIQNDAIPDMSDVTAMEFSGAQEYSVQRNDDNKLTYDDDDKYFVENNGETLALDTDNVNSYIQNITGLSLTDYVTYNASDDQLKKYGLDEPEMTVTISYNSDSDETADKNTDEADVANTESADETNSGNTEASDAASDGKSDQNGTFVLNISKCFDGGSSDNDSDSDSSNYNSQAADTQTGSQDESDDMSNKIAYVRVGDSGIIYKIGGTEYSALLKAGVDDLRHQQLVWADPSIITGMDVTVDGKTYSFTSKGDSGKKKSNDDSTDDTDTQSTGKTWYYNKEKIVIGDVLDALGSVKATSFTDETPAQKEEISLKIYLDNSNVSEVSLALYRYDGSSCLAQVDGKTVALVDRSSVVDLIEAVNSIVLKNDEEK